jgi:muramoyltetrapeptide carboxypeptidase
MKLIKPKLLEQGDTIAIIAPSGAVDKDKVLSAQKYFEDKGYNVVFGKNLFGEKRYMSGADFERLDDLHNAFANPDINAVFCARGGYGAIRLLPYIDFNIIRDNPKIFCGYSDITALSLAFFKCTGLITYSSPMPQSDFADDISLLTEKSFFNVLSRNFDIYSYSDIILPGEAKGLVWGGNLSTVVSVLACDNLKLNVSNVNGFIPDEKFIFFTEDIGEPVYKIDRMLNQLANIRQFKKNIAGIAFGEFTDTDNGEWLKDVLLEFAVKMNVPAYSGFKFTHGPEKQTIPIGVQATLNQKELILL